ncbi:MAG: hypothetical protein Q8P67_14560 [archaeon]|nr:hypothetical protein [archaeon]
MEISVFMVFLALRVVGMSVFPKTPCYFPPGALSMISEKAADAISDQYSTYLATVVSLGSASLLILFIQSSLLNNKMCTLLMDAVFRFFS